MNFLIDNSIEVTLKELQLLQTEKIFEYVYESELDSIAIINAEKLFDTDTEDFSEIFKIDNKYLVLIHSGDCEFHKFFDTVLEAVKYSADKLLEMLP